MVSPRIKFYFSLRFYILYFVVNKTYCLLIINQTYVWCVCANQKIQYKIIINSADSSEFSPLQLLKNTNEKKRKLYLLFSFFLYSIRLQYKLTKTQR